MSHEVETSFYAREPAWHGLGTVVSEAKNSSDALKLAGLDWEVYHESIFLKDGREIPEKFANIRSTDRKILGVVSDHYKIVQNTEAFSFTDALLENDEIEVKYESAGSLFNGKRIWLLAHLPERLVLGESIGQYLVFATSHDGTLANTCACTPIRIVCNNTLTLALSKAQRTWSFRHMGDIQAKKYEAAKTLQLACTYMDFFEEEAEKLQQRKVSKEMLEEIIEQVFPIDEKDSERTKNNVSFMRNQFISIYIETDDLKPFRGDAWGVYNAFGDFCSHIKPLRETKTYKEKLFASYITGNKFMETAQKAIETVTA